MGNTKAVSMKTVLNKLLLSLLLVLPAWTVQGQSPPEISLESLQTQARAHYPVIKQQNLLKQNNELAQNTLQKSHLPTLTLGAQGSWQSDVISIPLSFPGMEIPSPPQLQYKATLDVKQLIYDGGYSAAQMDLQEAMTRTQLSQLEVELYQIRNQVNALFFAHLLIQENLDQLAVLRSELNNKLKQVKSGIENGVLLPTNATQLEAELLRIDQQEIELTSQQKMLSQQLTEWTGTPLPKDARFVVDQTLTATEPDLSNRPEYELFQNQRNQLEVRQQAIKAKYRPKVSAFTQLGYGNPGLNMFEQGLNPWLIAGAGISWNILDWGAGKNQKQQLELQKSMVDIQEETFERKLNLVLIQSQAEMEKIAALMEKDLEVIQLRKRIKATASAQLDNGVITATDYLEKLNEENLAQLAYRLHQVQLLQAQTTYNTLTGTKL